MFKPRKFINADITAPAPALKTTIFTKRRSYVCPASARSRRSGSRMPSQILPPGCPNFAAPDTTLRRDSSNPYPSGRGYSSSNTGAISRLSAAAPLPYSPPRQKNLIPTNERASLFATYTAPAPSAARQRRTAARRRAGIPNTIRSGRQGLVSDAGAWREGRRPSTDGVGAQETVN